MFVEPPYGHGSPHVVSDGKNRPLLLIVMAAAAILVILTAAARAEGEGNGEPFAFHVPGQVYDFTHQSLPAQASALELRLPPAAAGETRLSAAPGPANDRLAQRGRSGADLLTR